MANPAVVGLAGFGVTTLLLQLHNLGLCGSGVIFCCALFFGGTAQLIAGLQEFKTGNNFGYSAFATYGAFWIAFSCYPSDHGFAGRYPARRSGLLLRLQGRMSDVFCLFLPL